MSSEAESVDAQVATLPRGRPLPLNSKKVTIANLQLLARGLELPTAASADELRQLEPEIQTGQILAATDDDLVLFDVEGRPYLGGAVLVFCTCSIV